MEITDNVFCAVFMCSSLNIFSLLAIPLYNCFQWLQKFDKSFNLPFFIKAFILWGLFTTSAHAVLLYDTTDPSHNTTAPSAVFPGNGWDYQGLYGSFLGTAISAHDFVTAQHFGTQGNGFFYKNTNYTVNTSVNGGLGYFDVAGTDLRVYRVNEALPFYAPLYTGNSEAGMNTMIFGRGGPRGSPLLDPATNTMVVGWNVTNNDGIKRWGANMVAGATSFGAGLGDMLISAFGAVPDVEEAYISVGDSGGGTFVQVGGVWQLAGIHYAVDQFATDATGANPFSAALYDARGYYQQTEPGVWTVISSPQPVPALFYDSRISSSASALQAIIAVPVPEPGSFLLLVVAGGSLLRRGRRS